MLRTSPQIQETFFVMIDRLTFARLASFLAAGVAIASAIPARAAEPAEEPVMLVARPALRDRLYGATILITKPLGNGGHMGFIVNKPTPVTLGKLFPDHAPSQKVTDPVYLGGPVKTEVLFVLVQGRDSPGSGAMQLMPDLHLVVERALVDRIIEGGAGKARFFAGTVLWAPGELRSEIDKGFWYVHDADPGLMLRKSTNGLWEELVKRSLQQQPQLPPGGLRTSL
jgi:putative transcriptional regulator